MTIIYAFRLFPHTIKTKFENNILKCGEKSFILSLGTNFKDIFPIK